MPQQTTVSVIEFDKAAVRFGKRDVLSEVTLNVPEGSIFALVGPNGAGKTTLLKTLMNMHRPTRGTVKALGIPSAQLTGDALCAIGYVSENQDMPGWMKLHAYLDYLRPFYPTWDRDLEQSLLAQFRLPADQKMSKLSRGQQMKAALLAALAYRPGLLLLDEPFSGLDPLARDEFIAGLLDRAAASEGRPMTVLLSSHDLAEIESFSTHLAYLQEGKIIFAEEIGSLLDRFREVTAVLPAGSAPLDGSRPIPRPWLLAEQSPAAYHFIHAQASSVDILQEVLTLLPDATSIEVEPMSLRQIFLSIARSENSNATLRAGGRR